jgi:hypothetical protein
MQTVQKPVFLICFLAPLIFVGCSDQLENENTALKAQTRSLTERRKSDDLEISNLKTNIDALQEKIRAMQSTDQEQLAGQRRTIATLNAESIRQKEDIENLRRTLADQKVLFEKYKDDVSQQLQKPGRVTVALTYKDGTGGGNVPDKGANISLHLIKDTTVVYHATADSEGAALLDTVKPGKYLCVIHSGNAHHRLRPGGTELVRQRIWKTDRTMLASYLDDTQIKLLDHDLTDADACGHFFEALLAKTLVREIEIGPQDDVSIKYDFGAGAF